VLRTRPAARPETRTSRTWLKCCGGHRPRRVRQSTNTESARCHHVFDIAYFTRSCDVINYVTNRFAIGHFLLVVLWKQASMASRFEYIGTKITGPRPSFHSPFDSPYIISYLCSIVTKRLSPAFLEILGHEDNGVMSLTFQGHVTSSVKWPFDSPYPISYSCSIVTQCVSPAVFWDIRLQNAWPVQIVTAHARYHVTCTPYAKFGYIF